MKICAITMTYRDHWALDQWYRHYARHLGGQNLYVVAHGADPAIAEICPGASIVTIPRDRLDGFDTWRAGVLNGLQSALVGVYDWVIRTDTDELICLDPERHASFADFFGTCTGDAVFALGLTIAERPGDRPLRSGEPALAARRNAEFSGHYSKAFAVRKAMPLLRHGIAVRPRRLATFPFHLPRGVYMAHLKYANGVALAEVNIHRKEIAISPDPKADRPGRAWRNADRVAAKFFDRFNALPEAAWPEAEDAAYGRIGANPVRDTSTGVIRAENFRADCRTRLPGWFGSA